MKTIYQNSIKKYQLFVFSILSIGITSCGSFKNSSYDDTDGIYSSSSNRETTLANNQDYTQVQQKSVYVEKFKQMEEDLYETEYFTDVDSYSSNPVDTVYVIDSSYAGWGNNQNDVNVNYFNNGWNNWGWNNWYGPGWNNGFYFGNTWGLGFNYGWNNWGWGWNNWYGPGWNNWGWNNWYGNGWYGNGWNNGGWNNSFAINAGRRGMNGYYPANSGRNSGRTATVSGRNAQIGNSTVRGTRTRTSSTRGNNSINSPRSTTSPRTTTTPRTRNTPRTTTSPRNNSNNSPRTISTPRSSGSSSGSFGGGRSSGGGGSRGGGGGSRGGGRGGF